MPTDAPSPARSGHAITITQSGARLRVRWNGTVIADTTRALDLQEATYPLVHYIPREDADMLFFERTARTTRCPFKGEASYFSLREGEAGADNAVWSYENPLPSVAAIAGHLAFYPDIVSFERDPSDA